MPIELGKILRDIAEEMDLRPSQDLPKERTDSAWLRVAKKNNLSVHEARSIFKVLQKKYDQEKTKPESTWKLFNVLKEIHTPPNPENETDEEDMSMEENEEYEMLEVDEEQHQQDREDEELEEQRQKQNTPMLSKKPSSVHSNSGMNSEGESPTKTKSDNSNDSSPERIPEKQTKSLSDIKASQKATSLPVREEKKVLNTLLSTNSTRMQKTMSPATAAAAALQKKGITLKKTSPQSASQPQQQKKFISQSQPLPQQHQQQPKPTSQQSLNKPLVRNGQTLEAGKTVQLPESIKRKLSEDLPASTPPTAKKMLTQPTSPKSQKSLTQSTISSSGSLLKKEIQSTSSASNSAKIADNLASSTATTTTQHGGIKVITFPADASNNTNNTNMNIEVASLVSNGGNTIATTTTNGMPSPLLNELDFSNNIIIDSKTTIATEKTPVNGNSNNTSDLKDTKEGIINLGNMTDDLPRNFFSNLCNSSRYEALALYVANVMNRMDAQKAAKLEIKIMRAVIDAQSEALTDS